MKQKFLICKKCKAMVAVIDECTCEGCGFNCCGEQMSEIVPGTTDASLEKHVPVITKDGKKVVVSVGAVPHPMTPEHYIQWISIETKQGNQRKCLTPKDKPEACFMLCQDDEIIAAYAYCNLHSLWKAE
ncbi:MAG: desulfoferrodoxin family protein [Bacillota bacterium]|nr:desulfoferrodoxin family protein [Bacillota bacterium]